MTSASIPEAPPAPPPPVVALQLMTGYWMTQAVSVAARLGVPDALAEGPRTAAEVASTLQVNPDMLFRIMRSLASIGFFTQDASQRFSLTPVGETLRSDVPGSVRNFAMFIGHPAHWGAWGNLLQAVRTGQDAFSHVHRMGFFEFAQGNPDFDQVFNAAMTSFSAMDGMALKAAYDFTGVKTLVDVGGGQGLLLATLLQAYPDMRGVLLDLPHVVEQARPVLEPVAARCERVGGDFFKAVPPGADAYIMKTILHDWPDEACVTILRNCVAVMAHGARVLVMDLIVPEGDNPDYSKFLDLEMLVMTQGGRERTEAQFAQLFAAAGLRLARVVRTHSPNCVIEAFRA